MAAKFYFCLPQDLVEDILSRLAVKSLIRFKCASKAWYALITTRQFAKSHFQRASKNPNCMKFLVLTSDRVLSLGYEALVSQNHDVEPIDYVDSVLMRAGKSSSIVNFMASCNGLVFVSVTLSHEVTDTSVYLVWNPSTRSYKNIPISSTFDSSSRYRSYSFGFGYDYSTDDYKILRCYHHDFLRLEFEIFSLKTLTWRKINSKVQTREHRNGTYFNGAIYWRIQPMSLKPSIIYFDLAEEIFHEVAWPEPVSYFTISGYVDVLSELEILGEHLCLSVCKGEFLDFGDLSVQLWVMNESWTWTRLATIPYWNSCLRPIFLSNNNSEVLMLDTGIDGDGVELIRYNLKENITTTIFKPKPMGVNLWLTERISVATYVESLYFPYCNDGPDVADQVLARN
ncbi:F-box/kelch-repeat protein At3g06240-like [Fagus crenata]